MILNNISGRARRRGAVAGGVAVALLVAAACGDDGGSDGGGNSSGGEGEADVVDVVGAFYPLQYVSERVGGPLARVTNLTPPGVEPHDLELTPQQIATLQDADLVVYLSGFSPAVDDAVKSVPAERVFDVAQIADLSLTYEPLEHEDEEAHAEDEGSEGEEAKGEEADDHGDEGPVVDPHFWLDPRRLGAVVDQLAGRMGTLRADGVETFTANAAALVSDLEALDAEFEAGLETCQSRDLVTSHNAFGYLASRYGLTQVGIAGLSPDEEPSPADLAEIADFVTANGVKTIYAETLVSPEIAKTIAAETGATVAVLDPLEGLAEGAAGDFIQVMRTNLVSLRQGLTCT